MLEIKKAILAEICADCSTTNCSTSTFSQFPLPEKRSSWLNHLLRPWIMVVACTWTKYCFHFIEVWLLGYALKFINHNMWPDLKKNFASLHIKSNFQFYQKWITGSIHYYNPLCALFWNKSLVSVAAHLWPCISLEWCFGTIGWSWLSWNGVQRAGHLYTPFYAPILGPVRPQMIQSLLKITISLNITLCIKAGFVKFSHILSSWQKK